MCRAQGQVLYIKTLFHPPSKLTREVLLLPHFADGENEGRHGNTQNVPSLLSLSHCPLITFTLSAPAPLCSPSHTPVRGLLFQLQSENVTPPLGSLPWLPSHSKEKPDTLPPPAGPCVTCLSAPFASVPCTLGCRPMPTFEALALAEPFRPGIGCPQVGKASQTTALKRQVHPSLSHTSLVQFPLSI